MTPTFRLLSRYLGRRPTLVVLCLIYALLIAGCTILLNQLAKTPMVYLDIRQ
jgi:hypothetical protein